MYHLRFKLLAAAALAMICTASAGAAERFDPATCTLSGAAIGGKALPAMQLVLKDGKRDFKPVIPAAAKLSSVKGGYASTWKDGKVSYTCKAVKSADNVQWTVEVRNASAEDVWLSINLEAALSLAKGSFWDGNEEHKSPSSKTVRTDFASTFPMTCAWDNKTGLAIGMDPRQMVSWLEEGFDPSTGAFWQGTRLVAWAGKTASISLTAIPFSPDYGYFSALQAFYDTFPASMRPYPGTDKRLEGGYVGGIVNHEIKDKYREPEHSLQEIARRSFTEWEWFFRPANFNFFIMDRPEYWEGQDKPHTPPAGVFGVDVPGWKGGSEREYTIAKNQHLTQHSSEVGIASMYYILSHGDKPLVEKYNWLKNNDYKKEDCRDGFPLDGDWGGLPGRGSRRLFPGVGAPAETLKKDMVDVLKTYSVRGFAWDSNRVDAVFRQPELIKECPNAAFDAKGPFVHDSVGYAMIIDYVHSLKLPDGVTAGMASNLGPPRQSYLISLRTDTTISEMLVVHLVGDIEGFDHDRIMRGRRSKTQLSGMWRDPLGNSINWAGMTPLEIREALRALHSQFLLLCLKLGIYPEPDSCYGYERTMKYLPAIDAATRAGWEPVSAMKGADGLWLSRFGKGAETILTVGNPLDGEEIPAGDVTLENKYTGLSGCVLTEFFGRPLTVKAGADTSAFGISLGEGDPLVCRVAGTVDSPAKLVTSADYRADRTVYTWKALEPVKTGAVVFLPEGFKAAGVTAAGKPVPFKPVKGGISFNLAVAAGQSAEITLASETILAPEEKLFAFPFVSSKFDAANCAIVIPDKPSQAEAWSAGRVQEYFRFYCAVQGDWDVAAPRKKEVIIPIVKESDAAAYACTVRISGTRKGVTLSPDGRTLSIGKSAAGDETQTTMQLLRALDKKYPYTGRVSSHMAKAMIRGMANRESNWRDLYAGKVYPATRDMLKKAGVLYGVLTEKEVQK